MKTWIVILLRSIGVFLFTLIITRLLIKNYSNKITPFNFINYAVIAILISLISVNIITNWVFGMLALSVWILLPLLFDYICIKSKFIYKLIKGEETVLIKDGKIMEENLTNLRLSGEDLLKGLRSKNAFDLADVEFAIMESTGDINVILKSDKKSITPHDLGIKVSPKTAPQTVILDGTIINESLSNLGLNCGWLNEKLEDKGVTLENVFIGQVDANGELYIDVYDDLIQLPESTVKEMLYANLEKAEADLESFALETENATAKYMYRTNANKIKTIIQKLEPHLLR